MIPKAKELREVRTMIVPHYYLGGGFHTTVEGGGIQREPGGSTARETRVEAQGNQGV